MSEQASLTLRLSGPLQSWGTLSQFNRRETGLAPSKSGIVGLLAAAQGRRRIDPIDDLVELRLGVRIDAPGTILRDYHTVSDFRDVPLLSAAVHSSGRQKPTGGKYTHVTNRFYLADALFVAVVSGARDLITGLAEALRYPAVPLALGRRACVPAQPFLVRIGGELVVPDGPEEILSGLPWQVSAHHRVEVAGRSASAGLGTPDTVRLATVIDALPDSPSLHALADVPISFDPLARGFRTRRVVQAWVDVSSGFPPAVPGLRSPDAHDPFALLGA